MGRLRMLPLAALLALAQEAAAQSAAGAVSPGHYGRLSPAEQVRWSEEEAFRASARRDSGRLRALIHADYFRLLSDGHKLKETSIRRWMQPAPPNLAPDAPANLRVRLLSPTTAITSFDDLRRTVAGDTLRVQHANDVWVKENGRWQLYAVTFRNEQAGPAVRAIRAGAVARNRAYAAHDTAGLAAGLAPDFQLLSGGGGASGRAANVASFRRLLGQRPDLQLVFTPETVEASSQTGSEAGTWVERWTAPDGPTELRGRYQVLWQLVAGTWVQKALLLVPTACTGGAYCQ